MKINEKNFYDVLKNIFVGAKIEGEGGYINLLKIKSKYYEKVLKQLQKEINEDPLITSDFKEEFFNKLYSFFERYFSESGSIYFAKTNNSSKIYDKICLNNKDVVLFWKTYMLYYVKSDNLFKNINIQIEDKENKMKYDFYFNSKNLQNKKNNEKKQLVFKYNKVKEDENKKIYVFDVLYNDEDKNNELEDISKNTGIPEKILKKAFRAYKRKIGKGVDFFINKNAKKFLEEQLDMYLYQILLSEENKFEQKRLDQLKTMQKFAKKIIAFISQFEDELVRVWNKPKFALNSNYVITIDKLSDDIINKIANHPNLHKQIKEWIDLGMVEEGFDFNKRDEKNINIYLLIQNILKI